MASKVKSVVASSEQSSWELRSRDAAPLMQKINNVASVKLESGLFFRFPTSVQMHTHWFPRSPLNDFSSYEHFVRSHTRLCNFIRYFRTLALQHPELSLYEAFDSSLNTYQPSPKERTSFRRMRETYRKLLQLEHPSMQKLVALAKQRLVKTPILPTI